MFSSPTPVRSVDNLSALSPVGRSEFPFHSYARRASRRDSTASSIHSVGGALDTSSSAGWAGAVHEFGQNAISTLLQPPIVRTGLQPHSTPPSSSGHRPPTSKDIPPVALTNIPHVEADEFAPYLSQVGALYEQLRRVRESEEESSTNRRGSRNDDLAESVDSLRRPSSRQQMTRIGSSASLSSLTSVDMPSPIRRMSSGLGRKISQGPPPLSTIPTVYFDEDFHLENPRTFDVVSERSEVIPAANGGLQGKGETNGDLIAPRKALATNAILQEKLSWYMDTIEVHLINAISTASTTFFNALGSLKELHSEAADSVQRISSLRKELQALDDEVATSGLQIAQKRRRQENLQQLTDTVLQLKQIVDGVGRCESLIDEGEVDEALQSIDGVERMIAGEGDPSEMDTRFHLRDLRAASALQGVNSDMGMLRLRIGRAYEAQFSKILIADLQRHVTTVSTSEVLLRWSNSASRARGSHARSPSVFPSYLAATDELRAQLRPSIVGLHRSHYITATAIAYRDAMMREIRNLIRRPLPSSSDDDNESMMSVSTMNSSAQRSSQEKSSVLARNLRALDAEDAEALMVRIYVGVTETLRRLTTQMKMLLDIASSLTDAPNGDGSRTPGGRSPVTSPRPDRHQNGNVPNSLELQEELHRTLDLASLLTQAVDIANDKIVKILKVRSEQATHLPLDLFLRYFTLNLYFANECEAISGRSGTSLKSVVNGHIKDFVQRNRDSEMQKLAQGMESDQWNARDFTTENATVLNQILESSTQDSAVWTERNRIWILYSELDTERELPVLPEANGAGREKTRTATVDSEKFVLPHSAILCLDGIANFLHLISGMPSMANDVGSALVAYLQLFNSRCTQLILGAGATRSAGLKNITTKHLALASQALSFIAALIPHTREFVRRHAGSGAGVTNLMGEFDKVRRQLQEHQDRIYQKLVEIMSGRAAAGAKNMKTIVWTSDPGNGAHPYMETLVKETTTLHRVLTKHLPETSIQMIMAPVFSSYKEHLGNAFKEADPETEDGRKSMLRDADLFTTKLGKIDGFGDAGDVLTSIITSITVESDEPAPAPKAEETEDKEAVTANSLSKPDEEKVDDKEDKKE